MRIHIAEVGWYIIVGFVQISCFTSLIYFQDEMVLILCTIVMGFSYGGLQSTSLVVSNLYFGSKNFGKNNGVIYFGTSFSGLILGLVVGKFYDDEANPITHECFGKICFMYSFFVCVLCLFFAITLAIILTARSSIFRNRKGQV